MVHLSTKHGTPLHCIILLFFVFPAEPTHLLTSQNHGEVQLPMNDHRWGPLRENDQILITFEEDCPHEQREEAMRRLVDAGGLFLYHMTQDSWLFLGNERLVKSAERVQSIVSVRLYDDPSNKISPEWWSVLTALGRHSLKTLAEEPLHQLMPEERTDHLFGNVLVDRTGSVDRLIIEVGFPLFHANRGPSVMMDDDFYAPAIAAAVDWLKPMQTRFGADIEFRPFRGLLDVYVTEEKAASVLEFLARQRCVHWLQPRTRMRLHNWRASGIIQSGYAPTDENGIIDPVIHPIWAAGIQGEGQIVGSGDSGVDVDSCFFYDPDVPFLDNVQNEGDFFTILTHFESDKHRKIRYYGGSADLVDGDGHGTHVVGTLLGNPYQTTDDVAVANRGMAPEALLAFLDLGGGSDNSSQSIYTPRELSTFYYPVTYRRGARIHSDSWGSESPTYDHLAQEVDKFVWENPDFLPVFAAGNYGQLSLKLLTTVTSPATAKNCISVGATLTANQATIFSNQRADAYLVEAHITEPEADTELRRFKILAAEFGASWSDQIGSTAKTRLPLIQGFPETGCTRISNPVQGKIVLLKRGECEFARKLINAQAKGAAGVLVMNDVNKGYFLMQQNSSTSDSEFTIPMASIPLSIGRHIVEALEAKYLVELQIMERTEPAHSFDNIADFSSSGPTIDFRFKPDIVAPGLIKSVLSDGAVTDGPGQCLLRTSSGTSMATPVVAGAAVLVRQYFMDGFYPTGKKTAANAHTPSAALIKATLLGGAYAMDGYTETGLPLDPPPSSRQGYGRVHLAASIPVADSEMMDEGWKLQVVDGANLTTGEFHEYCLHAAGGPIRVTLVWTDPPAALSASSALVNDLDLSVRSEGLRGRELLGNGILDRANNVERVLMDDMPQGNLAIVVKAHQTDVGYGPQPYALVVQGRFNGILQSPHNPYQSEATAESDLCIITLAVLESGPKGITKNNSPVFRFTTRSGVSPVNGFECKLTKGVGATYNDPSLHDWRECTSPTEYAVLADQAYTFIVRPKNEDIDVQRDFTVDTKPPTTEIIGTPIPNESAQETVTFEFSTTDMSPFVQYCKLDLQGNRREAKISRERTLDADMKIGVWFPCTSPETFRGLSYGNWTFHARGKDKAGNIEDTPAKQSWSIRYASGRYYVRSVEAPLAISSSTTVSFVLEAFTSDVSGRPVALNNEPLECRLSPISNSPQSAFPFVSCPSSLHYPNVTDGEYSFEARTLDSRGHDSDEISTIKFTVDSTEPEISYIKKPDVFHGARDLVLSFTTNEIVLDYNCSMRPRKASKRFIQCPGKEQGIVRYHLADGTYTFQVRARDQAGNVGFSEEVSFTIDSIPPQIFFRTPGQLNTNHGTVSFEFQVEDSGSGVVRQNHSCSLLNEITGIRTEVAQGTCTSPIRYNLEEGRYLFTLRAVDRAGRESEEELPIVVDFTPPGIKWQTTPSTKDVHPALVVFRFEGSDEPKNIASLVSRYECRLSRASENTTEVDTQRIEFTGQDTGRRLSSVDTHRRRLTQSENNMNAKRVRIRDGAVVTYGDWVDCEDPVVLTGMSSGRYAFDVRATDNAGNIGEPTRAARFTVDDTLPIPGQSATADDTNSVVVSPTLAIAIVVVSVIFVVFMCIVVGCWRRRSRRRRVEKLNERHTEQRQQTSNPVHRTVPALSPDVMLQQAINESLKAQQRDDQHRRQLQEAALYEQSLQVAMQQSKEQYDYQQNGDQRNAKSTMD